MNQRRIPGEGTFDLPRLAALLRARGFDGAIVLEVLNAEQRVRPLADYAADSLRGAKRIFG
jgi:sugar phosphate isomerase/epimerase